MRTITALFVGVGFHRHPPFKTCISLCTDRGWTLQADACAVTCTAPAGRRG